MKKLVSSSEAAKILGLSLQGIHYRIKKGQLESVKKDGKIFVYIDNKLQQSNTKIIKEEKIGISSQLAIRSKDEQIILLKKTLKYLKKQHDKELKRLDNSQNKILNVFQSEVDLLKSAFNEMKNIYTVEHKEKSIVSEENNKPIHNDNQNKITVLDLTNFKTTKRNKKKYMPIKDFFKLLKNNTRSEEDIKALILNKMKNGDKRFIYQKSTNEIKILNSDFLDII